jgi:hypothetical protein
MSLLDIILYHALCVDWHGSTVGLQRLLRAIAKTQLFIDMNYTWVKKQGLFCRHALMQVVLWCSYRKDNLSYL